MNGIRSAESQVLQVLRERILRGELAVGDRLRQSEIAADLRVSTTPVREAFRDLAAEGLVQIDTNRGAVIREFTRDELVEVLELQLVVETETLGRAVPNYTDDVIERAAILHERMRASTDPLEFTIINYDFHMLLSEPSGRRRSLSILRGLFNVATIQIKQDIAAWEGRRAVGEQDHADMLDAARSRDAHRMLQILRDHTIPAIEHLKAIGTESTP
ncbi:GntR family transcriptional regulator [Microbacterium sp. CPCC 204701]|uniref:GntR family transcriptional regulator n=1 Tax=Microbacterium sp. CPCC 204701 TaxID=2493084 RepID=UPI001F0C590C|nr:GntR family transcriptional regulator [Microbacterium sp. CPCC 204701]